MQDKEKKSLEIVLGSKVSDKWIRFGRELVFCVGEVGVKRA